MRNIEWTDVTWNPLRGCRNRCWPTDDHPEGNCYAAAMCRRHLQALESQCPRCDDFLDVHFHEDRLAQPNRWRDPRRVFCGSMTDLWTDDQPVQLEYWRHRIFAVMAATMRHDYVILTKRPARVRFEEMWNSCQLAGDQPEPVQLDADGKPMPTWDASNLVLGVSVTKQSELDRVFDLVRLRDQFLGLNRGPVRTHFRPRLAVSFEPLLEFHGFDDLQLLAAVDWIIVGAATGQVRSMIAARDVHVSATDVCAAAEDLRKPLFVKPNVVDQVPLRFRDRRDWPDRKEAAGG